MAFAGLWEGWRGPDGTVIRSFTIVTTNANAVLRPIHERMPVILERAAWPVWLGEEEGNPAAVLQPSSAELRLWRIGTAVNSVRNDSAALLEAVYSLCRHYSRGSSRRTIATSSASLNGLRRNAWNS